MLEYFWHGIIPLGLRNTSHRSPEQLFSLTSQESITAEKHVKDVLSKMIIA